MIQIKEKRNKTQFPLHGSGLCVCVCVSVTFSPPLTDSLRQRRTSQSQGDVQGTVNFKPQVADRKMKENCMYMGFMASRCRFVASLLCLVIFCI